ncbi:MAG TPA: MurR/RpiR family transcriptional regulator [Bacteroidota bacterium]|nr:MurR/RpiR family transcriptional regulator [Bacteroidota bacterium]
MSQKAQFQKFHAAIQARRSTLTSTQGRIAAYLLEQTQEIALISVHELAARLHTGPASIVRVVRKLGYPSFAAMKTELREDIRAMTSPLVQFRSTLDHGLEPGLAEFRHIAEQEVRNIDSTITLLNEKAFAKAVRLLVGAQHIYTIGIGISAHLAGMVSFILHRIGLKSDVVPHTGLRLSEHLVTLGKGDVLVAFSFPPYSEQTIEAAEMAKAQGVTVIGFTNRQLAPIAEHCNVLLIAKTESRLPTNSLSAPLLLIYGLTSAIAAQTRPRSLRTLEQTIKLRS